MEQAASPTQVIAKRVRELRTERKWNAQRLAEEVTKAGVEWNRGTVAKLENGRRASVSVAELFALAWAFGVAPIVLVLPDDAGASYQLAPNVITESQRVYAWLAGFLPPPAAVTDPEQAAEQRRAEIVRYFGALPAYMVSVRTLEKRLAEGLSSEDFEAVMRSRAVPMDRREQVNGDWWTRDRQTQQHQTWHALERAVDPEGRAGFWGPDGSFSPAERDPEEEFRKNHPLEWLAEKSHAEGAADQPAPDSDEEPSDG